MISLGTRFVTNTTIIILKLEHTRRETFNHLKWIQVSIKADLNMFLCLISQPTATLATNTQAFIPFTSIWRFHRLFRMQGQCLTTACTQTFQAFATPNTRPFSSRTTTSLNLSKECNSTSRHNRGHGYLTMQENDYSASAQKTSLVWN